MEQNITHVEGMVTARTRKVFARSDDDPPFPIFVNGIEVSALGMDVLMDCGVVSPETVNVAQARQKETGESIVVLDLNIVARIAMSMQTAALLHQRMGELLQKSQLQFGVPGKAKEAAE